jgi:acyl phosphate:glycerol-3-phosphate acyltransferase
MVLKFVILAAASYAIGAIPFSFIIARVFRNIDLRKIGSGNPGATNVYRTCGLKLGLLAFFLDGLKGFAAVYFLVKALGFPEEYLAASRIAAFFLVVCGHNWTVFLNFRGGKGIATSAGAIMAINGWIFLIVIAVFSGIVYFTGYVSLSSIIAALVFPALMAFFEPGAPYLIFSLALSALVIYRHKENIKRLMKGQEKKIYEKAKS